MGKKIIALVVAVTLCLAPLAAGAASLTERLLYAAAAMEMVSLYYNNVNEHGQAAILRDTQKRTGVLDNDELQEYAKGMVSRIAKANNFKNKYEVYVNPSKDVNAFCTIAHVVSINKGIINALDEDELAVVIGHELGHGELKHSVVGVTKSVGVGAAVDMFLASNPNRTSQILSGVVGNLIYNEVFTLNQEKEADAKGFDYAAQARYNPGAGAAENIKVRSIYGELWSEGLTQVINPNNHPKETDRVNYFAKRMTEFSGNHITVKKETTVQIDGKDIVTPVKTVRYLAGERAFLIAGNLARVYHDNELGAAYVGQDGAVYIGTQSIMTPADGDISAEELAAKINAATGKTLEIDASIEAQRSLPDTSANGTPAN